MRAIPRSVARALFLPIVLAASTSHAQPAVPRVERGVPFPLELPAEPKAEPGVLVVREDRSRPDSRLLRLPFVVLRSTSPTPAPDPVLYLPGGPGGSALNTARYGSAYPFLAHRDFIVFEPRGARFSDPTMGCPEVAAARVEDAIGTVETTAAEVAAARACRARVTAAGIDPSAYTTEAIAADVDDLRTALGYAQWNLYAASYGTRVGLAVLRQFPRSVRSAVLDSVLPPNVRYDERMRESEQRSLDLVFRACAADAACARAFPDLRRRWEALVKAADAMPLTVTASTGKDAPPRSVTLRGRSLAGLLALNDTDSLPDVPALMHGLADGDPVALARAGARALRPSSHAWGLRYSVWCAEETPFVASGGSGMGPAVVAPEVCRAWNVRPVKPATLDSVRSDVPLLLLSGDYDPDTPPTWAADAARTLSAAQAITFPGMSHTPSQAWSMPCGMQLVDAFIRQPAAPLDRACVDALSPPAFKTTAPKPQ